MCDRKSCVIAKNLSIIKDGPEDGRCKQLTLLSFRQATNVQTINIEDDHLPFMRRGVKIVHLIPYPFPSVWHTRNDDISAIDMNTLDNFSRIMNVFVADYFGLTTLPETSKK